MTAKSVSISMQYRSPEYIILFTPKPDNTLTVKIYTIACKTVYNSVNNRSKPAFNFGTQFIPEKIYYHQRVFKIQHPNPKKVDPLPFLEQILEGNPLKRSICYGEITIQGCIADCHEEINRQINKIKEDWLKSEQVKTLCCPITLEIFKDPVIDDHGHTFERDMIEKHLKEDGRCPINREPIRSLAPNLDCLQQIQQAQAEDPIPTLFHCKNENQDLARKYMEIAMTYEQLGKFQEAIQSYSFAFQHTKKSTDYQPIAQLYKKMNQPSKTILALLYLALYQLQENKVHEVIETLTSILYIDSKSTASLLLVKLYRASQNKEMALKVALEKARSIALSAPQLTLDLYKQAVILAPYQFTLYQEMQTYASNPQEKAHCLLIGACQAFILKDFTTAMALYKESEPFSHLFLDRLFGMQLLVQQQSQKIIEQLARLSQYYREKKLFEDQLKVDKMIVAQEERSSYYKNVASAYEELKKPKKAVIWYHKQLNFLIKEKRWQEANQLADEILNKNPTEISVYQTLKIFYQKQPEKLSIIYGKLGQIHLENKLIDQADATYREGLQKFPCSIECAMGLAKVLKLQEKFAESVQQYYKAAEIACIDDCSKEVSLCLWKIKEIDPNFKHLEASQRMKIMLLNKIANLQKEMMDQKKEIADLKKEVNVLEKAKSRTSLGPPRESGFSFGGQPSTRTNTLFWDRDRVITNNNISNNSLSCLFRNTENREFSFGGQSSTSIVPLRLHIQLIGFYLDLQDLIRASRVSKSWKEVVEKAWSEMPLTLSCFSFSIIGHKVAKAITELDLSCNEIDAEGAKTLSNLINLRKLKFKQTSSFKIGNEWIKALSNLPNLTELNFDKEIDVEGMIAISNLLNLRKLKLNSCEIEKEGAKAFSNLSNLTELDLSNNNLLCYKIGTVGVIAISNLINLRKLNLSYSNISIEWTKTLSNLSNLTELNLGGSEVSTEGAIALSNLSNLTELNLGGSKVSIEWTKALSNLSNLTELNLSGSEVSTEWAIAISKVINLRKLILKYSKVSTERTKTLSNLSNLTELDLSDSEVSTEGAIAISNLSNLTELNLSDSEVSTEGAIAISKVINLRKLNLSRSKVSTEGTKALSNLSNLIELNLSGNKIGTEGAVAISNLSNLTELYLSDNEIGTEGAIAISNLSNLTELNLRGNKIGTEGAEAIVNGNLSNLISLSLGDIGMNGIKAIANGNLSNLASLSLGDIGMNGIKAIANGNLSNLTSLSLGGKIGINEKEAIANGSLTNIIWLSYWSPGNPYECGNAPKAHKINIQRLRSSGM